MSGQYSGIRVEKLKNTVCDLAEILVGHLPNINPKCCHLSQLARSSTDAMLWRRGYMQPRNN
jgi:hypothetical protein